MVTCFYYFSFIRLRIVGKFQDIIHRCAVKQRQAGQKFRRYHPFPFFIIAVTALADVQPPGQPALGQVPVFAQVFNSFVHFHKITCVQYNQEQIVLLIFRTNCSKISDEVII